LRSRIEQCWRAEMLVACRTSPDGGCGHDMRQVHGSYRRLAHVCVQVSRKRAKPRLHCIGAFRYHGEVAALDDLLNLPQLLRREGRVFVPDRQGGCDIRHAVEVGAKLLESQISIVGLVCSITVEQDRSLVGHDLLEHGSE